MFFLCIVCLFICWILLCYACVYLYILLCVMHETAYYLDYIRLSYERHIITVGIKAMLGIIVHSIRLFMSKVKEFKKYSIYIGWIAMTYAHKWVWCVCVCSVLTLN